MNPSPIRIETIAHCQNGRLHPPEQDVEQRRERERQRPEQVRGAPPDGVGDDPGRHLEQHHAGGEERVGRERLEVREPGVEQEDRVDAPDQRRRERVPEQQHEVRALDLAGLGIDPSPYGRATPSRHRGRRAALPRAGLPGPAGSRARRSGIRAWAAPSDARRCSSGSQPPSRTEIDAGGPSAVCGVEPSALAAGVGVLADQGRDGPTLAHRHQPDHPPRRNPITPTVTPASTATGCEVPKLASCLQIVRLSGRAPSFGTPHAVRGWIDGADQRNMEVQITAERVVAEARPWAARHTTSAHDGRRCLPRQLGAKCRGKPHVHDPRATDPS